ncbi:MAG: hypothetical protein IJJ45_08850 [Clostridia bacterium]|nr:hypothetical protein [Clostridia bacterium]MBR3053623.1 hypothetical protein [Bacillota bacterium]
MKKWIALLMVLALAAGACAAMAEDIDLAPLTDDEIVGLLDRVQQELVARHIERTATLMGGTYVAGRDVPAGSYVYTCLATGDDWGNVTIYSEQGKGKQLFWEIVSAPEEGEEPESFFITLNDGDQLESPVPFSLKIHAGVQFK